MHKPSDCIGAKLGWPCLLAPYRANLWTAFTDKDKTGQIKLTAPEIRSVCVGWEIETEDKR